ncbi:MAG: two-component response regulator [Acidobacteria bacterium]|jgi:DNA-binding response OmpR family regulator|nr:two-component response regulator [Acidobacteriota bacterium]
MHPRVLYVETNKDSYFMISTMLGFSGIEVQPAHNIAEALQLAQTEHFDLYLLDTRFPKGSGLELCRLLRKCSPQIPIVFYSGDAYAADKAAGISAGADAYLVKPDSGDIAATIFCLLKETGKRVLPKLLTYPVEIKIKKSCI